MQLGDFVVVDAVSIAVPLAGLVVVAEEELGLSVGGVALDLIEEGGGSQARRAC